MAGAELSVLNEIDYVLRKLQKPRQVRYRRAIFPHPFRNVLVAQRELVTETLIGAGLLNRVQILPLDVLDNRLLEHVTIGELANNDWDAFEPSPLRGSPAPLSG